MVPLAPSFDTFGVLVREPSDLRLAYEALTGAPAGQTPSAGRLLVLSESALDADRVEQAARAGASEVASALADRVDVVDLPPFSDWARPRARVIGAEALRTHGELGLLESSEPLGDDIVALHAQADALPAASVRSARADLRDLADGLLAAIGPDDVLVTPALPGPPPARTMSPAAAASTLTRMVAPVNAAGLAAAALSLGSEAGVQLIARSASTLLTVLDRLPTGATAAR
jgi:amidase